MTVTIPRAEVHAVAEQHNDALHYIGDPNLEYVRYVADEYRRQAHTLRCATGEDRTFADGLLAEADDLDALADRYEKMAQ